MKHIRRVWQFLVIEPFIGLFYCFFQPARFKKEYEEEGYLKRIIPMFRLILPVFFISYPCALMVQISLCISSSESSYYCYFHNRSFFDPSNLTSFVVATAWASILAICWGIAGGILSNISLGVVLALALAIIGNITGDTGLSITRGLMIALALGLIGGMAMGISLGFLRGIIGGAVGGIVWGIAGSIRMSTIGGIQLGIFGGFIIALGFIIAFFIGYYRFPLYIVSAFSQLMCYFASQRDPTEVFTNLHHSSLYWDQYILLPLPRLTATLLLAANQNEELALQEILFIASHRTQQIKAARTASVEIAIRDLERRAASIEINNQDVEGHKSLPSIARVSSRLTEILPQSIDPRWAAPFARLKDISSEALRYESSSNRQIQRDALANMIADLEKVYPYRAFKENKLNKRLNIVVNTWLKVVRREQERLEKTPIEIGQIDNPYTAGPALEPSDSRFVGRRDLVQQLEEALNRGNYHPTFLLNGERRMGKSSTLKQLPNLLGARYIPIFFDLQKRGTSSSIATFLGVIADEIHKVLVSQNMQIKKLGYKRLREANRQNEAAVYHVFDEWLEGLEEILEQEDRTLLLTFDEFEKLEEAGRANYLDVRLLLDWFRTIIQHSPRLALLFSGVHDLGEMSDETGIHWANYLLNVQTLRVSFLKQEEAYKLITCPIPNFPGEQIFGEVVVQEIMRTTGCHPFLVQAVCANLINNLNDHKQNRATLQDVEVAVNLVLENWRDTYFRDLWERTNKEQRICLATLKELGESDPLIIQQQSGLHQKIVRQTLDTLLKRDLVRKEEGKYSIATPIFYKWVEYNN